MLDNKVKKSTQTHQQIQPRNMLRVEYVVVTVGVEIFWLMSESQIWFVMVFIFGIYVPMVLYIYMHNKALIGSW